MPYEDGRRYPYSIPVQKHSKGRGSKAVPKTDHKDAHLSESKGSAGSAATKNSQAKRPSGTPISGPGGRNIRSNTYG